MDDPDLPVTFAPRPEKRDFGWALRWMKLGRSVVRIGWREESRWVCLVRSAVCEGEGPAEGEGTRAFLAMKLPSGAHVPWTPTQEELLAEDYREV